jgi:hypothetical protein
MAISSHTKATIAAALVLALVALAMIVFEKQVSVDTPGILITNGVMSETQKQSLSAMLDLVKLMMNWALATVGAVGLLQKTYVEKGAPVNSLDLAFTFSIVIAAISSAFLGHLVIDRTAEVLALDQFPLNNPQVRLIGRAQYFFAMAAIGLFGLHMFQFFWARRAPKTIDSTP